MTTEARASDIVHIADVTVIDPAQHREQLAVVNFLATYTGATRDSYQASLARFYEWCTQHEIRMLDVTRGQLELYLRHLEKVVSERTGKPLAQSTIAGRFGAVANFLAYATDDDLIPKNPAARVRRPKIDREAQKRHWLDIADLRLLTREASRSTTQDRALIMLMTTTGMRVAEVCSLDVTDLHLSQGHAYVEYIRKGGLLTRPNLPIPTLLALQLLIDQRPATGPLFVNARGARFDRRAVQRVLDRLLERAGIEQRVTPHDLRRSFATAAIRLGVPRSEVQAALYQKDPRTMEISYVRVTNAGAGARHMVADILSDAG